MILLSSLTNCPSPVKKVEQTSTIVVQLSAVAMSRQHTIFRLSKQVCLVDFGKSTDHKYSLMRHLPLVQ